MKTLALTVIVAIAGIGACLIIINKFDAKSRRSKETGVAQSEQLAAVIAENQRLSNLVARTRGEQPVDGAAELAKLRSEAQALRQQTNDLGKRLAERRESPPISSEPPVEPHTSEYWEQLHQMSGAKSLDACKLASGMLHFAMEHDGQFPTNLDQIASFLNKEGMSISGTNQFDIVYEGSLNRLEGIPMGTVAVVRDRLAWRGPDGKTMRVYGMGNGTGQLVSSDDNFQSWEARHVIALPKSAP